MATGDLIRGSKIVQHAPPYICLMVRPGRHTQSMRHIACPSCACQAGRQASRQLSLAGLQSPVPSQQRIGPGRNIISMSSSTGGPGRVGAAGAVDAHPHTMATEIPCPMLLGPGHI